MIETLSLHHASTLAHERRADAPRIPRVPRNGGARLLLTRLGLLRAQKPCEGRGC
jgi:hypothetical protein